MAGLIGISAEDMEQVDALRKLRADYPDGFPLIRPHVLAPVLVARDEGVEAVTARFGFSRRFSSFNARDDKLTTGKMWSRMFGSSHGLVPLSYVVEWVEDPDGKRPFLIRRADGRPMMAPALVGTYFEDRDQQAFAICTRRPNRFVATFHDRMVGQCPDDQADTWLHPDGVDHETLLACVAAPDDDELVAVPADPKVAKRKAGDWSAIQTVGDPVGWDDLRDR